MRKIIVLTVLLILRANLFGQLPLSNYPEMLPVIDAWLDAQRDFDRLPGISVAIVKDQDIIFQKGYGYADVETKNPMKPETICSICSISKLFTSIAIMQLWEQHKINLDDSLQALLPDFKFKQQYAESVPITVRSMLTHSSGLQRDADSSWNPPNFYFLKTDELKKFLSSEETLYPASTYFQYSNLAMSLLGEVVHEKSNESYKDYVEQNILLPLQLGNTHPYLPKKLEMATGYSALSRDGHRTPQPLFETNAITPAAGFSSNVIDLAKFASWQLRLLAASKPEVLHPSTLKEMQRIQWASADKKLTWGLGFMIRYDANNAARVGHDGSCPGYVSGVIVDPKKKLGVAVMVNAQGVDVYKYSDQIFNLLSKFIASDFGVRDSVLKEYAGRYDNYAWSGESIVIPVKGKLLILGVPTNTPADNIGEYKYIRKDHFRRVRSDDQTLGEELIFERDEKGRIKRFLSNSYYQNRIN